MGNRSKYKKVSDLYRRGTEVVFEDGTVMYLQAMNSLEVDEARRAASVVRARFAIEVRQIGSAEHDQVLGNAETLGDKAIIDDLVRSVYSEHFLKASQDVQSDPEFKEKWEIVERSPDLSDRPEDDPERQTLELVGKEFFDEVQKRLQNEQDLYRQLLDGMSKDDLLTEYSDKWIEKHGQQRAIKAYNLSEVLHACRVCDAVMTDEKWDHSSCDHSECAFESIEEIEALPEDMLTVIVAGIETMNMTVREAKN